MTVDTAADLVVRRATAADNAACCELFSRVTMNADVVLSVDRRPDFHAAYRLQGDDWTCWLAEADGRLAGMGTIVVRDGYIDGRPTKVGYLGDLRLAPGVQGRGLLGRFYGPALQEAATRTGADVFLTTVIASNTRAIAALTGPKAAARGIPPYTLLRRFAIRTIWGAVPAAARRGGRFAVRPATPADIPAVARLLDRDGRSRPYGPAVSEGELRRRLARWPGLSICDFLLAVDHSGQAVGCLATWDAHAVKRTVVADYRGRMRVVRTGYNLAAAVLRLPRLPAPGGVLPSVYVTHQAVPSGEPAVMAALLRAAYADVRRNRRGLLSVCVWEGDPLAAAYAGFVSTDLAAHLYAVTLPGAPIPDPCPAAPPGFEMALA